MSGVAYTKRVASTIVDVLLSEDWRLDFDNVQQNINMFVPIFQDETYKAMFNIKTKSLKILRYFKCMVDFWVCFILLKNLITFCLTYFKKLNYWQFLVD